jgi:type I restriction enzyme S subunit
MKKALAITSIKERRDRDDLPQGWAEVLLPEICILNPPKPPSDALAPEAPVTFVPMPAVDEDLGTITKPQTPRFADVRKGYTAFQEEDVIMAKITPCMENGKAAVARNLENSLGFGSTEFHVFRSNGAALPEYIFQYIRQESYRHDAESEMTGSVGQKRVPVRFLEQTVLPLPPLPEQKRIITAVGYLSARLTLTRDRLAKAPKILKAFRQSVLAAACSGRLTQDWREKHQDTESATKFLIRIRELREKRGISSKSRSTLSEDKQFKEAEFYELPDSWVWCKVGDIATVGLGGTPSRKQLAYWGGKIPWVSSGEVANRRITNTAETITHQGLANSNAKVYPTGTVLIAMIGEGKNCG